MRYSHFYTGKLGAQRFTDCKTHFSLVTKDWAPGPARSAISITIGLATSFEWASIGKMRNFNLFELQVNLVVLLHWPVNQ